MVYNRRMIRILVLFLIFFVFQGQAFAYFEVPCEILQNTVTINQNKKIFRQNMQSFENFLEIQHEFPTYARFFAPSFVLDKQKDLKLIAIALYFNILKNEELQNIQKEEITLYKVFLDENKKNGNFKEIEKANEAYNQAQIEYLAYKKTFNLCKNQLKNFSGINFDFTEKFDNFDLEKIIKITCNNRFSSEQDDISEHLKYEYKKYKNLEDKIQKQPENTQNSEAQYDLLELKKSMIVTKLRCIVYYFSLREALN